MTGTLQVEISPHEEGFRASILEDRREVAALQNPFSLPNLLRDVAYAYEHDRFALLKAVCA